MTPAEAADYLHLNVDTLKRKARQGDVPAAKTGRKWLFRKQDLDAWLAAGGSLRQELEDEGIALVVAERKADPANHQWKSVDEFKRERGL